FIRGMNLLDELKWELRKKDNTLVKLILVNIIVFVLMGIVSVVSSLTGNEFVIVFLNKMLGLPSSFMSFLYRPWTLITYGFVHSLHDIFHIVFNMFNLYWFGRILSDLIGSKKLLNLYLLGSASG